MKQFTPYAIAIALFLLLVCMESCGSTCRRPSTSPKYHRTSIL